MQKTDKKIEKIEKLIRKFCLVSSKYATLNESIDSGEVDAYRIELMEIKELAKVIDKYINTEVQKAVNREIFVPIKELDDDCNPVWIRIDLIPRWIQYLIKRNL